MKPYEPPIFPPWTGQVSPLIDPRERSRIDPMPGFAHRHLWIWTIFIASGFLWGGIFAVIRWVAE